MTTLAGTCAAAVLLLSVTVAPPVGAAPLSVTVPCEPLPPTTLVGFSVSDTEIIGVAGVTFRTADAEEPPKLAEIVELAAAVMLLVVIANVAVVAPTGTITLAGTCPAVVLLLLNVTIAPPVGAAPLSVTVPCELLPPTTLVGFSVSDDATTPFVGATSLMFPPPPQATSKNAITMSAKLRTPGSVTLTSLNPPNTIFVAARFGNALHLFMASTILASKK